MSFDFLNQKSSDFKKVFGTEEGQRVLGHIYKMCGMNHQIHDPIDPHGTSFNAGKHRIGQGIQSILSQTEDEISQIIKASNPMAGLNSYDPFNQNQ